MASHSIAERRLFARRENWTFEGSSTATTDFVSKKISPQLSASLDRILGASGNARITISQRKFILLLQPPRLSEHWESAMLLPGKNRSTAVRTRIFANAASMLGKLTTTRPRLICHILCYAVLLSGALPAARHAQLLKFHTLKNAFIWTHNSLARFTMLHIKHITSLIFSSLYTGLTW